MALKSLKAPKAPANVPDSQPATPSLKKVTVLLKPRQWRQIKEFVLEENTSIQGLVISSVAKEMARKGITLEET